MKYRTGEWGRLPPAATSALLRSSGHPTSNCGLGRQRSGHLGSKGQGGDGAWCCVHTERERGVAEQEVEHRLVGLNHYLE